MTTAAALYPNHIAELHRRTEQALARGGFDHLVIPSGTSHYQVFDDRRFILFCRSILAIIQHLREVEGWEPDVLHANDWHTGLLPDDIRGVYSNPYDHIATVYASHNRA